MYDVDRMIIRLRPLGFELSDESETDAWFVRANETSPIFEQLNLIAGRQRGGDWGDSSHAFVLVGVKPGRFSPKGLTEAICLTDWVPTKTDEEADAWERNVVSEVEHRLPKIAKQHNADLLTRTAACRTAVSRYMALIDCSQPMPLHIDTIAGEATREQLSSFERMASTPGLICLPDRTPYDLAIWLIVKYSELVEPGVDWCIDSDPLRNVELNWRIQLLSSRLLPERGWELIDAA
jgi:hypothetical protein